MTIVAGGISPPALGWDHRAGTGIGDVSPDLVRVVAAIRQQLIETTADGAEQRPKALLVVRLSRRQDEGERKTACVAAGVEFGREATARSTKRLGRASPFFMPAAQ